MSARLHEHLKRREIEVNVLVFREQLVGRSLNAAAVAEQCDELRRTLLSHHVDELQKHRSDKSADAFALAFNIKKGKEDAFDLEAKEAHKVVLDEQRRKTLLELKKED